MTVRGWLERRTGRSGTVSYRLRFTSPNAAGSAAFASETVRQRPGEDPRETKRRAQAALDARLTDIRRQVYTPPAAQTLGAALDAWLADRAPRLAPATITRYRTARTLLPNSLAQTRLDALTAPMLTVAYRALAKPGARPRSPQGLTQGSIRNLHKLIFAALRRAHLDGVLPRNVAAALPVPGRSTPERAVWTTDQVARFLAHVDDDARFGALYRLMFTLGLRVGELLALRWEDVELERVVLSIRRTVSEDERRRPVIRERPKTKSSRRDVALPPNCVEALRSHRGRAGAPAPDAPVFPHERGGVLNPNRVRDHFHRTVAALGLPPLRLHDARHCAATELKRLGVHPWVAADILGHGSTAMTRHYSHGTPEAQRAALAAVERSYAGRPVRQHRRVNPARKRAIAPNRAPNRAARSKTG